MTPSSPSVSMLKRSQEMLHRETHFGNLLQQEVLHAASKRPRIRFAAEADLKIQKLLTTVLEVHGQVQPIEKELNSLELKVDKLDLEREQYGNHHIIQNLSFQRSPYRTRSQVSSSPGTPTSPKWGFFEDHFSLSSPRLIDYLRKRNLVEGQLSRIGVRVKSRMELLDRILQDNFQILKFKRAEHCLLKMIRLQRKFKKMEGIYFQTKDRLLAHVNSEEDF